MASDVRVALGGKLLDGGVKGIIHLTSMTEDMFLRERALYEKRPRCWGVGAFRVSRYALKAGEELPLQSESI
jgi:hypothetical protein